ncbi:MAG: PfkB family carbohydrate kinase [Spirochaetota bacterium]
MEKHILDLQGAPISLQNVNVVVVGTACTDVFVKTDAIVPPCLPGEEPLVSYKLGSKILVDELEFHTGGGGANAAGTFARLGLKTAFIGRIGTDIRGHRLFQWLYNNNIMFLGQVAGETTGFSVILRCRAEDHYTYLPG